MLERRLEDTGSTTRFVEMVLGLVSFSQRVEALSATEQPDGACVPPGPLLDFFLGIVSAGRTLRAVVGLSFGGSACEPDQLPAGAPPALR